MAALGQSTDAEKEKDPFKNDPFFSKPLHELLRRPDSDVDNEGLQSPSDHPNSFYLSRVYESGLDFGGALEAGPYNSNVLYGSFPSLPMIHFNRVSGLFLGVREERMQWYQDDWFLDIPSFQPHGLIGYSFGQNEWNYILGAEKLLGKNRHVMIGGEYHHAITTDDYWRVGMHETTLTSLLSGYDYLDYYKQTGWGVYFLLRTNRYFEGGIAYSDARFSSLAPATDFALFGSSNRYRANPPVDIENGTVIDTLSISSLTFTSSLNPKRLKLSPNFAFSLTGSVELGDPGIGSSDYSYTKYLGELTSYVYLEQGGVLKYRLKAGTITGNAPLFKEFQLGGVGSLRALPFKSLPVGEVSGNQMILSNLELHLGSPGYGLGSWIDFEDIYLSLFLDSGWVSHRPDLETENKPFADFSTFRFTDLRHNGGFGVGTSFIRCELAWDLDHTSRSPVFWIRLNPTF
jgi:hypothetical protein